MDLKSTFKSLLQKRMLVTLLMGFSSGLPLLLTIRTLQAWMTDVQVDLKVIGYFSLVGAPYTFKFLWAPIMDRYQILKIGRRRGWLLISQIGLLFSIAIMGLIEPKEQTALLALLAIIVSFFSASQDIVVDAYRRESLTNEELAMGSTFYIYGYRIAMWVSGGLALGMAEFISWPTVYLIMASIMLIGIIVTIWADEPKNSYGAPKSLMEAVINPFYEFLKRSGSIWILAFILFYKIGDVMAGNMLTPFYLKIGYTKLEIAAIAKTLSLPITLFGGFIGGLLVHRHGIIKCLWVFGVFQMIATFGFNLLLIAEHSLVALGIVILGEDLATSMATSAFVAYMASMTNKKFTATQYALLSSLMGIPRVILSSPTGVMAEKMGWFWFFTFCTLVAIPGLLLISILNKQNSKINQMNEN